MTPTSARDKQSNTQSISTVRTHVYYQVHMNWKGKNSNVLAGGIAYGKEDGLVLGSSFLNGFFSPWIPIFSKKRRENS